MSIKPLSPEAIETFSLVLHPKRHYVSSSLGHTGSVKIFSNPSAREKDAFVGSSFIDSKANENSFESILRTLQMTARDGTTTNLSASVQLYMDRVNAAPTSAKNTADIEILRHIPTTAHSVNTEKKKFVIDRLMPFYRAHRSNNNWAYPNYHSVNFFTASSVPSNAAWLYPNVTSTAHPSGCYSPSGSFAFELMLNPRYSTDAATNAFKAGTIIHLSSSYALSLVTGSARDSSGKPNGFRLLLQLSSSADIVPSLALGNLFAFQSDDNSLVSNKWQHVLVTWGTNTAEAGTGSFYVDGIRKGTFVYPSGSILPPSTVTTPATLCIGNFYEGPNTGTSAQIRFFANETAVREGLHELDSTTSVNYPLSFGFKHQLNAEFHDLSIREEYVIPSKAKALGLSSPHLAPINLSNYLFYLPPFFVPGTPYLTVTNGDGGVLFSPFHSQDGANESPFSAQMSFGVAGKYNSLENFTRDFATNRHARLLYLTTSVILNTTADARTANQILYATSSVALRNLNVLPCDDGNFRPNFDLISELDLRSNPRYVDDIGAPDTSLISLRKMVSGSIYSTLFTGSNGAGTGIATSGEVPANLLAVYQRTQDPTSNEVVFFDLSNLFFGQRIRPGSLTIIDTDLTGSNGKVKVTLIDDGNGGLFRGDCESSRATWNHVGNIFYEEGILAIKSPALPFYGINGFDIEFEGEKSVHVSKLNVIVDAVSYNTSSNLSWNSSISASFDKNIEAENQKYITVTGVNFHDADLNVVMRAQLTQPIVKRSGDRYLIRIRYDW